MSIETRPTDRVEDAIRVLLLALPELPTAEDAEQALRRALGDPTLRLGTWRGPSAGYVDAAGRPFAFPADGEQAVTRIGYRDHPVAVLAHDRALLRDRGLLTTVAAVARVALDRDRVHAELVATIDDLRASRARLAHVAATERRRLERNLHDGAQSRLVFVSHLMHLARRKLGDAEPDAATLLDQAIEQLAFAHDDLRELARGLHPMALTSRGLRGALGDLARRASLPVAELEVTDAELPDTVELAAYFVVAEALTNAAKYAGATAVRVRVGLDGRRLFVDVSDDGRGGAVEGEGSGLRGLRDRVEALSGTLEIDSPIGAGTRLLALIPLDDAVRAGAAGSRPA